MRWFKHFSNARRDPFLRDLQLKFGNDGYAAWFKTIEMLAEAMKDGNGFNPSIKALPQVFAEACDIPADRLENVYTMASKSGKIRFRRTKTCWIVQIPKLLEFKDEYTEKAVLKKPNSVGTQSRQHREDIGTISGRKGEGELKGERKRDGEGELDGRAVTQPPPQDLDPAGGGVEDSTIAAMRGTFDGLPPPDPAASNHRSSGNGAVDGKGAALERIVQILLRERKIANNEPTVWKKARAAYDRWGAPALLEWAMDGKNDHKDVNEMWDELKARHSPRNGRGDGTTAERNPKIEKLY